MLSLRDLLMRQELVVSRQQALAAGMSAEAWEWKLESGRWRRVVPGVAVAHTGDLLPSQRNWAAVLHGGPGALLTGDALLHSFGFPLDPPRTLDVLLPHHRRAVSQQMYDGSQVRVRRTKSAAAVVPSATPLPTVTRHIAVLHAAAWAPSDRAAEWRVAAAVQRQLSAVPLLRAALPHLPRLPRATLLRTVLDDVEMGAHAGTELAFLRFLRTHGLPRPDELQVRTRLGQQTAYLDARYRKLKVTFEIDGAHHRDAGTWEADALRTLRLAVALPGERVVRITMGNIRHDGPELAVLLRALLLPQG